MTLRELALLIGIFTCAYAGFLLLALSQQQNWKMVLGTIADLTPRPRTMRWSGSALLGLALPAAVCRDGLAIGATLWIVVLIVAAAATVATLTWQAPLLRWIIARR